MSNVLTQCTVADLFVERYASTYRYAVPRRHWLRFNGTQWEREYTGRVFDLIRHLARDSGMEWNGRASLIAGAEKIARYDPAIVVASADGMATLTNPQRIPA